MKKLIPIIFTSLTLLTACVEKSDSGYVDVSRAEQQYSSAASEQSAEELLLDDKAKVFLHSGYSVSSNQFAVFEQDRKKLIDLNTGIISSFCNIPGCPHDDTAIDTCKEYMPINNPIFTKDGMYYTNYFYPGKLFFKSAGEEKTVFENTFYTDKEAELEPDAKTGCGFFIRGETIYVTGMTYFYTVDISTMKQTCEPVVISESPIWNADVSGDMFYVTNENLELISYDMKSGELKKLADKVWRIQACDDSLYYIKTDEGKNSVFKSNPDGSNEKKLISDTELSMYVTDKSIYYLTNDGLYSYDLSSGNAKKISLELTYENGERYMASDFGTTQLISCPSSRFIYLLDYTKSTGDKCYNALFRIDKETNEVRATSLGIWYQPENGREEILSY